MSVCGALDQERPAPVPERVAHAEAAGLDRGARAATSAKLAGADVIDGEDGELHGIYCDSALPGSDTGFCAR